MDTAGRAWVLSNRPVPGGTALELFDRTTHRGTFPLAGHVVGFQLLDSMVVALTDALDATDGAAGRRLDWYVIRTATGALPGRRP